MPRRFSWFCCFLVLRESPEVSIPLVSDFFADQKSRPLGTRIKRKDLGPGACVVEAELVELAWLFSEKERDW